MITCHEDNAISFTEERAFDAAVERQKEGLADQVKDKKHKHLLKLDMGKVFIWHGCGKEGSGHFAVAYVILTFISIVSCKKKLSQELHSLITSYGNYITISNKSLEVQV